MEAYKYIMNCPKCNYHLLFNDSDTIVEKIPVNYACELYTKRKTIINHQYYLQFNTLEELIKIINDKKPDEIRSVQNTIKIIKYIKCPNCGEKIVLNSILFSEDVVGLVDLYSYRHYYPRFGEAEKEFLIRLLDEIKH